MHFSLAIGGRFSMPVREILTIDLLRSDFTIRVTSAVSPESSLPVTSNWT